MPEYFDTIFGGLDTDQENLVYLMKPSSDSYDYDEDYYNHSLHFIHTIQAHSYQKLPNGIVIKLVRFEYAHLNYIVSDNLFDKLE